MPTATQTLRSPEPPVPPAGAARDLDHLLARSVRRSTSSVIRDLLRLTERPGMLSLAGGLPAADALPLERIRQAAHDVLAHHGPRALQYSATEGLPELRELISNDEHARMDQVIITTGAQQAIDLLTRVLCDPDDLVVVEDPAYVGALQCFTACGARIVRIETDADGMRTDLLEELLIGGAAPKFVYVVTDLQNPTGATLSAPRREHLAALALRFGFVVVEDDPYGALRFDGARLPRIRNADASSVVSLGTASKVLSPGLRVGWMIVPGWLRDPLVRAKQSVDLHTSTLAQLLVAETFADRPFMRRHLRRVRADYAVRADALVDGLRSSFGDRIDVDRPAGGMFAWVRFTDGTNTAQLLSSALAHGVAFVPGAAFTHGHAFDGHARMCFTTLDPQSLRIAALRLAQAHADWYAVQPPAAQPPAVQPPDGT